MLQGVTPDAQGIIHYGVVRVEHNYLGVYIRNWAPGGALNRFTRVVLTPKQKVNGRIDLNTVQLAMGDKDQANLAPVNGVQSTWHNALMGIPGVLANYNRVNGTISYPGPATPLSAGASNSSNPYYVDAYNLANRIVASRDSFDWIDGRYFRFPSDLLAFSQDRPVGTTPVGTWNQGILHTPLAGESDGINSQLRFDESYKRFTRMSNLITTRSDTFEIIVTAQSGYLSSVDENLDGSIDYRDDFVTTGEKKVRVVYER